MLSSSKFSIFSLIVSSGDPFEQLNSRHSLQTSEHTKPFLRQTHLFVLQSPLHPHRIILSRSSGAIGLSMKIGQSIWSSLSYHPQSVETNSWVSRAIHVWTCRKTRMLCWWQATVVSGKLEASICVMSDIEATFVLNFCRLSSSITISLDSPYNDFIAVTPADAMSSFFVAFGVSKTFFVIFWSLRLFIITSCCHFTNIWKFWMSYHIQWAHMRKNLPTHLVARTQV